jgi:hypothetical protein
MELHLDLTDHAQARQQIVDALNRQRGVDTVRKAGPSRQVGQLYCVMDQLKPSSRCTG